MGVNNTSTRLIQQIYLDSMALWLRKLLVKRFKWRFVHSTGKSRGKLVKFLNTIGHRSINGLCFYARNQTNIYSLVSMICTNWNLISICSVISQNVRASVAFWTPSWTGYMAHTASVWCDASLWIIVRFYMKRYPCISMCFSSFVVLRRNRGSFPQG